MTVFNLCKWNQLYLTLGFDYYRDTDPLPGVVVVEDDVEVGIVATVADAARVVLCKQV